MKILHEIEIPLTHWKGKNKSYWKIQVVKYPKDKSYSIIGLECGAFNNNDNALLSMVFTPFREAITEHFNGLYINKGLTKKAKWANAGHSLMTICGFKNKATAIDTANWFKDVADIFIGDVPNEWLDRDKENITLTKQRWQNLEDYINSLHVGDSYPIEEVR